MLDVDIQRNTNGSLSFDVFRKPTYPNQNIHFNSYVPLQHKLRTLRSLTCCTQTIPSTEAAKAHEEKKVRDALTLNRYPDWAIKQGTYKAKISNNNNDNTNSNNDNSNSNSNSGSNSNSNNSNISSSKRIGSSSSSSELNSTTVSTS